MGDKMAREIGDDDFRFEESSSTEKSGIELIQPSALGRE
jgi:hypothetical protein